MRHRWFQGLAVVIGLLCGSFTAAWAQVPLLSAGSDWRYLDDGSDQGTAWFGPGFSDGLWPVGPAELGYGDGNEATTNQFGPDENNKHATYYYRHTFNLPDPSSVTNLRARLKRDDGAIVYLNGVEVIRDNMPEGPVIYTDFALGTLPDDGADFAPFHLDPAGLVAGANVVAVEIHQVNATSSDISFDFELVGNPLPEIQITSPTNGQIIASSNLLIGGEATPGGPDIDLIEVFANGVKVGESTNESFNVLWQGAAPGAYTLTAVIEDSSGLMATSAPVDIILEAPPSGTIFTLGGIWKYFLGTGFAEASVPSTLWRNNPFNDTAWSSGPTPIGYGEGDVVTTIPSSATGAGNYLSVYLRKQFNITSPGDFETLQAEVTVDDGAVAYINGVEIGRINVPAGELLSGDAAVTADERRTLSVSIPNPSSILVPGQNVMAIHLLNGNQTSSDIFVDASLLGVIDVQPPTINMTLGLIPPAGATVRELTAIEVVFSEDVQGVEETDLLINGEAATNLVVVAPNQYVFEFPEPPIGAVQVAFSTDAGITDTASSPNPFLGASWSYTLDPNAEPPGVIISELMAANGDTLNDEDGDSSDWLELYNAGTVPANLDGWFLTDDPTLQDRWRIPNLTLLPNSFIVIFASGKDRTNIFANLHTDFSLRANGEFLALLDPDLTIVSAYSPAFPEQFTDISYGRDIISPDLEGYFDIPTPGLPNSTQGSGVAPTVSFSMPSRTFINPFNLTLSTPDNPGAQIRYVLVTDAASATATNVPTQSSTLYTGPIPISGTVQVRARAFLPGLLPGTPSSESYIRMDAALASFTSDLPLVVMHNFGSGEFPSGAGTTLDDSTITLVFDTKFGVSSLTNLPDTASRSGVNLRGSSTQGFEKRSYAVEFWDEFNQDVERPVLDFEPESDWVLYAPNQFDISLMHNPLAYQLSNDIGEWAPRTRFVEVFANTLGGNLRNGFTGSADYRGIYALEEKIKRDNGRLDIDQLEPVQNTAPEVTGGYLLKVDRQDANERSFSAGGLTLIYQDPDGIDMVDDARRAPQVNYIRDYVNAMNTAINAAGEGYLNWIDEKAFIDHNLVNFITMNVDAFRLSGFMFKPRDEVDRYGRVVTPGKFKMGPVWDFDRAAGTSRGDTRPFDAFHWKGQGGDTGTHFFDQNGTFGNPWYRVLFRKIDFWQKYVDRYQELREAEFSTNHIFAIIDEYAAELANAQPREAARNVSGGSDTRPRSGSNSAFGYTYQFDGTFAREVEFQKQWFADHLLFIDTNFVSRPLFSSGGGMVTAGFQVTISGPSGATVYYTLDGTDPRALGGGVAPGAQAVTGPITINANALLVARARNPAHQQQTGGDAPPIATTWSGPRRASFLVQVPSVRITEIMYHDLPAPLGSGFFDEDFEYIELKNIGAAPVNLNGYRLGGAVRFTFPNATLAAGESAVVVSYIPAFQSRYGTGIRILGEYQGLLDNNEEDLELEGRFGEPIHDFQYDDDWHPATDGFGFSLVVRDENAALTQWGLREGWRPSGQLGGSPGANNGADPGLPAPIITEALTHTDVPQVDAIEIYNPGPGSADISGWFLSDDFRAPKFRIPDGTVLLEDDYVVFDEEDFNLPGDPNGFNLRSSGDEVYLFSADALGNLTGYITGWEFDASLNGVSFGLHVVTSTGAEEFVAQSANTLGGPNAGPRVGPLVISEVMYHPLDIVVGNKSFGNNLDEYIELQNLTGLTVPLFDPNATTNTYRLRDAVDYIFPENQSIGPNGRVLVVGFDPANAVMADDFRTRFGVDPAVPLYGPFDGNLGNGGESVELIQPDQVVFYTTNIVVTGVQIDKVEYQDVPPWPVAADGFGASLQRLVAAGYGNDPANWTAALPTPGAAFTLTTPPTIDAHPMDQTVVAFTDVSFSVTASGPQPLTYQWRRNGVRISGATGPVLDLTRVTGADDGIYDVVVFNDSGWALSDPALLTVLIPASIIEQPQPVSRRVGESVTFSVQATSSTPISYQWLLNDEPIAGATAPQLVIDPVEREDDGIYEVVVSDAVGSVTTDPVRLTVLIDPAVVNIATNLVVVQGGSITLSIETDGTLPMSYRWRKNFGTLKLETIASHTSFVTLTNVQPADGGAVRYTVVMTNEAFFQPGLLSAPIFLTVLADTDGDGMPDQFETDNGFSTTIPDADLDEDLDGVNNGDEFTSGTDPLDPDSYLKVESLSSDGDALIEFHAAPNVTYTILYKDTVDAPVWSKLTDVAASTTGRTVMIRDDEGTPQRFYQLVTPRQE